jgi:hypothetical protein
VFLGERLRAESEGVYKQLGVTVTRDQRVTKEYPNGQEVYALTFEPELSESPAQLDP